LQEIEEERTAFAQISAGADVDIKQGQAHGLRLEEMQKLAQSPTAQRKMQQDPAFQENVIKRMKQHEHQLTQQQNAQIGRLGA
jgi:DNA-binding transcriptional MerR regulator